MQSLLSMLNDHLEKIWQARYERWATVYHEEYQIAGWSPEGLSRRLALVLRLLSAADLRRGSLVLDLGAGPGTYTRAINKIGHYCLGLDYSRKVIEVARKKGNGEPYLQGEAYHLPFQEGIFGAVICIGVLQSLEHPENALKEIARVLSPGGHLFLDGLNRLFWLHNFRHWKETLKGERRRMNYYNPYHVRRETERLGFSQSRLHWLAIPRCFQRWVNHPRTTDSYLAARLAGHAFLLEARKATGGEACGLFG